MKGRGVTNTASIDDWSLADLIPVLDASLRGAEDAAGQILEGGPVDKSRRLFDDASQRIDEACDASPFQDAWACRPGCSACCFQSVPITPVEALAVADYLRDRLSPDQLESVRDLLRQNEQRYSQLSVQQRGYTRVRCAFLDAQGHCSIHPSRPLRCRGFHSFCATQCELVRAGETAAVPIDPQTNVAMRGVQSGMSAEVQKHHCDGDYYELHSAVLRSLDVPDARRLWERGENVFVECARPNAVPDDLWIAPQEDGSVVKLRRLNDPQSSARIQLVHIQADRVLEQPVWHVASPEGHPSDPRRKPR
jgi:Fe-S-cluster containining protein